MLELVRFVHAVSHLWVTMASLISNSGLFKVIVFHPMASFPAS